MSDERHWSTMETPIKTRSGVLDLTNPHEDDISIDDIATALSRINRYCGQTNEPISVAQHCVYVMLLCPSFPLEALMHDLSEAVLFFLGEHVLLDKLLIDSHSGRTAPTAVRSAAMHIA